MSDQNTLHKTVSQRLVNIYGEDVKSEIADRLVARIEEAKSKTVDTVSEKWTEQDAFIITYGDSIKSKGEKPLQTLLNFVNNNLKDVISIVHILPFFPYSSDDGFSVIDYKEVNPDLGDWSDIKAISEEYRLMADLVINHISSKSQWFKNYLKGKEPGTGYFIEADPKEDLSAVVRPRSLPLLSEFKVKGKTKHLWTTFSADQIDLNFSNPELLIAMTDVFLNYLENGSRIIRLDAIAFLWKEIGTNCLHLPQTHEAVKLLRDIMDYMGQSYILLTETNVPNKENLSYFGNGDEANMVYQFSLPPLLLYSLYTGNARYLSQWASEIPKLEPDCTFFNFTASHDGIGVRPLEGLVPNEEFKALTDGMKKIGAHISTKRNSDGSDSPYEMNITYLDALAETKNGKDEYHIARFIASQTVMMSLQGIPAFYIHSLLGTRNYTEGVKQTGMPRTINRRKWKNKEILPLLEDKKSDNAKIFNELRRIIGIRKTVKAFHPDAAQKIYNFGDAFFVFTRGSESELLCITNVTNKATHLHLSDDTFIGYNYDLISDSGVITTTGEILLKPYQTMWLVEK